MCVCVHVCACRCTCSVTQSCLTLWDPMDCSPPGSSIHGIFRARALEWGAISFSRGSSQPRGQTCMHPLCLLHWQVDSLPLSYLGGPILGDTVTKSFAAAEQESPDFFACSVCVLYSCYHTAKPVPYFRLS